MVTAAKSPEKFYLSLLVNDLTSMARSVEATLTRAIESLLGRDKQLATEIFLLEPRINEMEIVVDELAVRLLLASNKNREEIRLIVASLKINNDLERIGDLAVNIGQRVVSLAQMPPSPLPADLEPMAAAVRGMVSKALGALADRNAELAKEVLESDDLVDRYRDAIFERLLSAMRGNPAEVEPGMQFVLATRYLERIADHCTNIAEDVIFWIRGLDVRHGRGRAAPNQAPTGSPHDLESEAPKAW